MSQFLCVIDDGVTCKGYIAAVPRLHGEVRFEYRPVLVSERSAWIAEMERTPNRHKATAALLARKVVSWDVKDAKGELLPCNKPDSHLRLVTRVFDRLLGIVTGQEPSDPDPQGEVSDPF